MTATVEDVLAAYEPVIGLETHVELGTASKMFCGCSTDVRRRAEHADLRGVPRAARRAAGRQPDGDRVDDPHRPGAELLDRVVVPVRAQELLLSGHAEELPDLAVRRAAVRRRLPGRRRRRRRPYRVGIERVHLEEDTGKNTHVGTSGRIHGADYSLVDYNRAGIPLVEIVTKPVAGHRRARARGRARVRHGAARHPAHARRQRRAHGAGLAALRRQHLAEPPGADVGHAHRDEERQLAALGRAGGAVGDAAPGRRCSTPASGSCRRPGTSPRRPATPVPGGRRRKRPTTGTSPSPTSSRSRPDAGPRRALRVGAARTARRASRAARRRRLGVSAEDMVQMTNAGVVDLVAATVAAGAPVGEARNWWLGYLAQKANEREIDAAELGDRPGAGRAGDRAGRGRLAVDGARPAGRRRRARDRSDVDAVVAERGLQVVSDTGALEAGRRRGDRRQPGRRREGARRQDPRGRRARRRGHEGDARPGRRRGGARDPARSGWASRSNSWSTGRGTTGWRRPAGTG